MAERNIVALKCTVCRNQNYFFSRGKKKGDKAKVEVQKFCSRCNRRSVHKESKL